MDNDLYEKYDDGIEVCHGFGCICKNHGDCGTCELLDEYNESCIEQWGRNQMSSPNESIEVTYNEEVINNPKMVGYCKECGEPVYEHDSFIYECSKCGYPHRFDELTPFDM